MGRPQPPLGEAVQPPASLRPWLVTAGVLHAVVVGALWAAGARKAPEPEEIPLEVSLGLDTQDAPSLAQGAQAEAALEATRSEQSLPQLPKHIEVEAPTPPEETAPSPAEGHAVVPAEPPAAPRAGAQTMSAEELRRRAQRERLARGKQEVAGATAPKPAGKKAGGGGGKDLLSVIPEAPGALGPSGSLQGNQDQGVLGTYMALVNRHASRFWSLTELHDFHPGLKAAITFRIDVFGHILDPRIERSSGDVRFDQEALAAAMRADPFPGPPPVARGSRLVLNYQPRGLGEEIP